MGTFTSSDECVPPSVAGKLGLTENTEDQCTLHSDTDSTVVGDCELIPSPPGDALQEPCSNADPQMSDARPEEKPLSSGNSAQPDGMTFSGNASGVMAYQKRKLWSEFYSDRGFDHDP